jgi:Amt family ammonium transporter
MRSNGAIGAEANGDLPVHMAGEAFGASRITKFKAAALGAATLAALLTPAAAFAQDAVPTVDKGDTAWMLTSSVLVLMMTVPGLALFYGGLVRKNNVLTVLAQSLAACCVITLVWFVAGYSLAFSGDNPFIGDLSKAFLSGVAPDTLSGTIPETVFFFFQMTFAIITPALITGAFADRMKFSALLLFYMLWSLIVYAPICHMVWAGSGYFFNLGALDFAGGTVVHMASGISGLVIALMIGKRRGHGKVPFTPHNLVYSVIGVGLLWGGWFGFNAGSALSAGTTAGMTAVTTQIAAAGAGVSWAAIEWLVHKKASVLGIISGIVAGLVGITPAAGFVTPGGALIIGLAAGIVCFFASTAIKNKLGYDDALDAFGIHGVGGTLGALLTGVFATVAIKGGDAPVGVIDGNIGQLWIQIEAIVVTFLVAGIGSAIIYKVVDLIIGCRVPEDVERDGLDLGLHGEAVQ